VLADDWGLEDGLFDAIKIKKSPKTIINDKTINLIFSGFLTLIIVDFMASL